MAWTTPRTWTDGELVTAAVMNAHVRDNLNASAPHLMVRKTADESVTSNTTLQNDDVLLMAIAASEVWRFTFDLLVAGGGTGDLKVAFTFPAGGTLSLGGFIPGASAVYDAALGSATASPSPTLDIGITSPSTTLPQETTIQGVFVNAGSAGNLQLQWAQNVSNGTATVIKANSTLWAVKLA